MNYCSIWVVSFYKVTVTDQDNRNSLLGLCKGCLSPLNRGDRLIQVRLYCQSRVWKRRKTSFETVSFWPKINPHQFEYFKWKVKARSQAGLSWCSKLYSSCLAQVDLIFPKPQCLNTFHVMQMLSIMKQCILCIFRVFSARLIAQIFVLVSFFTAFPWVDAIICLQSSDSIFGQKRVHASDWPDESQHFSKHIKRI